MMFVRKYDKGRIQGTGKNTFSIMKGGGVNITPFPLYLRINTGLQSPSGVVVRYPHHTPLQWAE